MESPTMTRSHILITYQNEANLFARDCNAHLTKPMLLFF